MSGVPYSAKMTQAFAPFGTHGPYKGVQAQIQRKPFCCWFLSPLVSPNPPYKPLGLLGDGNHL